MTSMYHKVLALIKRPPDQRSTRECQELVDWLRAKSKILANVKYDVITEVIRYCTFETRNPDDLIIKQGDRGHRLYIALQGHVSIYVISKETASDGSRDNNLINEEVLQMVTTACEQKKLDRNALGTLVWSGAGGTFGEVALIETDCVRTASVVADTQMDLLIVDRDLFNRCLRGIVAEDMQAKTEFVERNPAFRSWPPRQRKQLVISLTTERVSYGARIIRQGQEASQIHFISRGEVEINVDPRLYKSQFKRMWEEMETLVPDLNSRDKGVTLAPHEARIQRLAVHKPLQICLLGENEHLGGLEMILGLDNYMESATARSTCTLLKLRRQQYERLFKRKYAIPTLTLLKDNLATRLCLYIYQCLPQDSAFLKYLNMRLADASLLASLRKSKQVFDADGVFQSTIIDKARSEAMTELMKRLHMPSDSAASLPLEDMSEVALANMDKRLKTWSQKSRLNGSKLASIHTPHNIPQESFSPSLVPART